jgi:hydroxymethylpyrimidine/phosphomethylpyrimidine kinase
MMENPTIALTVAGIDSGGAAGLHTDIKTFNRYGVYGVSAVTVVTAQNSLEVYAAQWSTQEFLSKQLEVVLSDYRCDAAKTGMIGKPELVESVARVIREFQIPNIVVDPVLVNHRGESMFTQELIDAYKTLLFPSAICITPNVHEAILLSGVNIEDENDAKKAADVLHREGVQNILIKRVRQSENLADLLSLQGKFMVLNSHRIESANTHGSGDTLSAAIVACIARGQDLVSAITDARSFTQQAILGARDWRISKGHGPLSHF